METDQVHIRCGDDIVGVLKSRLPGEALRWADPLSEGPPRRPPLSGSESPDNETAGVAARARFLAKEYGGSLEQARAYLHEQDQRLEQFTLDSDGKPVARITLWFEHDLFDHIILLYLLEWLAARGYQDGDRVRLLQIDGHASIQPPDSFRGLGQLSPEALTELYAKHDGGRILSEADWRSAHTAHEAWLNAEPLELAGIAGGEIPTTGLPYLAAAFARHLREFPDVQSGLGATERLILESVQTEARPVGRIFHECNERDALLGLGDAMFWPRIAGLAFVEQPSVECRSAGERLSGPDAFYEICRSNEIERLRELQVSITDFGRRLLAGDADHVAANGIDCWRGGVRLQSPGPIWRWDPVTGKISRA